MLKITLKHRQINSLQRIFAIRGAENNSARVSAAREARMTAFVTQSSDVFNENGRLTTESTTTDDDANVDKLRNDSECHRSAPRGERTSN